MILAFLSCYWLSLTVINGVCTVADPSASDEADDNEKVKKKQKTDKRKATTRVTFSCLSCRFCFCCCCCCCCFRTGGVGPFAAFTHIIIDRFGSRVYILVAIEFRLCDDSFEITIVQFVTRN